MTRPLLVPSWDGYWRHHAAEPAAWDAQLIATALRWCVHMDRAVDGGAHVGAWSRALAEHFAEVRAFEPCEENRAFLQVNCAGLDNVVIRPEALAEVPGEVRLARFPHPDANSGQWMVSEYGHPAQAITLDSLGLPGLDLLKLDLEGFELPALLGGARTIARCRPVVVIEEGHAALHRQPERGARDFLIDLGYRIEAEIPADGVVNLVLVP